MRYSNRVFIIQQTRTYFAKYLSYESFRNVSILRKSFALFAKRLRIHKLIKFIIAIDDFRFICDQMIICSFSKSNSKHKSFRDDLFRINSIKINRLKCANIIVIRRVDQKCRERYSRNTNIFVI